MASSSTSSLVVSLLVLSSVLGHLPLHVYSKGGFSVELIHRDSPDSPLYDPTSTASSRLKAAVERSRARAKYFGNAIQNPTAGDNFYSEITPGNFEYLMSFYLGSPAEKIVAIADTGSDLIWIQCKPCDECYHQKAPLFDPQASSTYKVISCNADSCSALPQGSCGSASQCEYNYKYGDGSFVDGFLSGETISFDTIGGRRVQFPKSLFGCTHSSKGTFDENDAGLVGLGGGQLSLIRQLGSAIDNKFSYCLPSDQTNAKSRLNFGSSAVISGSNAVTTPLISGTPETFYFLNLEQISVAGEGAVAVKPAPPGRAGNIIIDSGTTLTLIDDDTLQSVESKVKNSVNLKQVTDPSGDFSLCFDVSGAGGNAKFPDITFHFSGVLSSVLGHLPLHVYSKGGFSVELIHRDSPDSPLYDPTSTASSRLKAAVERSRARAKYFGNVIQNPTAGDNFYSEITPGNFEYLMSFYLGSPAEKIVAIADTGSDLIWIQCKPCDECYHQKAPLFDPQASSTYKVISCNADSCSALPQGSCGSASQCEYNYKYGDGSFVDGFLSGETISFDTIGGRRVQFPKSLFGCTHSSKGTFDENDAGLVGLGGGQLSLIRQLGSAIDNKFSYCLPSDQTNAKSRLNFGSSAISVAGEGAVAVKPAPPGRAGNIIIDSGTTLTLIDDDTLQSVESKVKNSVNLKQVTDPSGDFSLCFDVSGAGGNAKFPDITFHFAGGAPVVLHQSNAFVESAQNILCHALISSDAIGVNIFGNVAQRNFNIGYDLGAMTLTLAPTDCANL
ncbi:Aspartic proteinase CDR1 [Platanthera guangdongensis]|uniref:Aspartic proteinase CDR1 n=1 Tax=Platanthera guangdongensis TaxID=2320717 RepID=A0ABR2N0M1_9ASPA